MQKMKMRILDIGLIVLVWRFLVILTFYFDLYFIYLESYCITLPSFCYYDHTIPYELFSFSSPLSLGHTGISTSLISLMPENMGALTRRVAVLYADLKGLIQHG